MIDRVWERQPRTSDRISTVDPVLTKYIECGVRVDPTVIPENHTRKSWFKMYFNHTIFTADQGAGLLHGGKELFCSKIQGPLTEFDTTIVFLTEVGESAFSTALWLQSLWSIEQFLTPGSKVPLPMRKMA